MEPSNCQSCNQDNGLGIHPDESLGTPQRDVDTEDVREDSSSSQIEIDRAIDLLRFVFKEGMAFLDNGSERSLCERVFVDMGNYLMNQMFENPGGLQRNGPPRMRTETPTLQSDIGHAFAKETRKAIANEIKGDFFGIYVDVFSTRMFKSYMVLFARYLNRKGEVVERLLGIVPDPDVRDSALKVAVDSMLSEAGLSWSNVRGQGYGLFDYVDEVFTELRTSITNENALVYYVHSYVCQLHSSLVSSYDPTEVSQLFRTVDMLSNLIKDRPQFTVKVCTLVQDRGVNLESDLKKPGETQWGSYYETLIKFAAYFTPIWDALDFVEEDIKDSDQRCLAYQILGGFSYDLAFGLLLMIDVLSVTNELSLALDRKEQDTESCMALLLEAKKQLHVMRNEGWTSFINKVGLFCSENDIHIPNMGAKFKPRLRSRDKEATMTTNLEHYHADFFERVINNQLNQLKKRFSKQSSSLVLLSSCLSPRNCFQAFDKGKLVEYARFYPTEFSGSDIVALDYQLQAFVADVRSDFRFHDMNTLSALSMKMVETGMNAMYPLVYLLLKLALILLGTPAIAKTASSAMKFVHSTMVIESCNQWFSDCLLLYLKRDLLDNTTNDAVIASL